MTDYKMGLRLSVCQCICPSVGTLTVAFLDRFSTKLGNPISALNARESPKFSRGFGNRGRGTRWWRQILDRKWKYGRFAHAQ